MGDWKIWRRKGGMEMLHGEHREVRYAIPADIHVYSLPVGSIQFMAYPYGEPLTEVPVRCVRAVGAEEDLPESHWVDAGTFPARGLLMLYEPEEEE